MQQQEQVYNNYVPQIRENFGGCPTDAVRSGVQDTGKVLTPCQSCTSMYMVLKDRSDYDKAYLRTYNRLPSQYNTRLDTLVFAP